MFNQNFFVYVFLDGAEDLSADEEESLNQRASRSTGSDSGLYRPPRLQAAMYNVRKDLRAHRSSY